MKCLSIQFGSVAFGLGTLFLGGQEAPQLEIASQTDHARIRWEGKPLETYFFKVTDNLQDWLYLPSLQYGQALDGSPWEILVVENEDDPLPLKQFFQVAAVDIPLLSNQEAEDADYDGDGLPNLFELESSPQTDPLAWDSDGDGIGDGGVDSDGNGLADQWEIAHFGSIGQDPDADPDGDGITNLEEYLTQGHPQEATFELTFGTEHYQYDGLGRLVKVLGGQVREIVYDPSGNIEEAK